MISGMKMLRTSVPGVSALLIALVAGCADETQTPTVEQTFLEVDHIIMYEMENVLTTDGVRAGIVMSDSSYIYEDSATAELFGVRMTLFAESTGVERSRLTAEKGWLNQRTDELTAVGSVVLEIPADGRRIETAELYYDPVRNRISSDSSTLQIVNGARTRATCGFNSDLEFRSFNLCGPIGDIPNRGGGGGG